MQKESGRPTVVIAMNAYRPGGSQTYAFTLAKLLEERGYSPLFVAKHGPWFKEAARIARAKRVLWTEGTAKQRFSLIKRLTFPIAEAVCALRLAKEVGLASLIITSQPGPTAFFARMSKRHWPGVSHLALVHGTTDVEWPLRDHDETLRQLSGLLAATPETSAFLRKNTELKVEDIGNLFRGELFWGDELPEVIDDFDPYGPVVFLGTLTANKTGPLAALLAATAASARRLIIVGGGPVEATLRRMVEEQRLTDLVSFTGPVEDPRKWIRSASAVVTAGRGALESMSGGRPTIVATSDGVHGLARLNNLSELLRFNFTGRTPSAQQPDADDMSRHLNDGIAMQKAERHEIARRMRNLGTLDPIIDFINAS